jgi:ATP/maltotriose-dependent transcriptional regulator MalT
LEVAVDIVDKLIQGREAFRRHEWLAARDRLSARDLTTLAPADLHALSTAAYLVGDADTCVRGWQRAFQVHHDDGDHLAAARDALWLTFALTRVGNEAAAKGWQARAARLLESEPDDVAERGFLQMNQMFEQVFSGRFEEAFQLATDVAESGRRHRRPDLIAVGLMCQGRITMYSGRVPEALALLDEAMALVAAGEVSPILAGTAYCTMVEACQEIDDYRRMTDWTRMLTHWCDQQPDLVAFTGQCAVHRAQIMRVQGAWSDALEELELALARYESQDFVSAIGEVHNERGEVLRLQGELEASAAAYEAAADVGHDPQPGQLLLWLSLGRIDAAVATARRLVDETPDPVHRSRVLSAVSEVLIAAGDLDGAAAAADELDQIATAFGSAALSAAAGYARGSVALARSDPAEAISHLRQAWRTWLDLGARYHAAWARARIGQAFRAMGDEDSARAELVVARRTFEELGAAPAQGEVERLLGGGRPDGLTARELEVLRLVAAGRTNPQIAAELFLSEKTVARHLSNIFGKTHVTSRTAAAAYAFQHQLA